MAGFAHNFSFYDNTIPYFLRKKENTAESASFGRTEFELIERATERKILEYSRGFSQYGKYAFQPFKKNDKWYAFVGTQYNDAKLIDLAGGSEIAILDRDETGGNFCPTGFYVPSLQIGTESVYHSKEKRRKNKYDADNKVIGWCSEQSPDYAAYEGVEIIIPAHDHFLSEPDYEFCDYEGDIEQDKFSWDNVYFTNHLFMCGVWWAADYEWLVYKIDIDECFKTGKFSPKDCVSCFDYFTNPDVRQYVKLENIDVTSLRSIEDHKFRYNVYDMKLLDWS